MKQIQGKTHSAAREVILNMGHAYPRGYASTSYGLCAIKQYY
jgi:hypothetical protein